MVDTGFNGQLWPTHSDATAVGVDFDEQYDQIGYLAGMRPTRETTANLRITWFGEERVVEVIVDLDSDHRTIDAREPMVLVGTALLDPARLSVNFERRTLAVSRLR